MNAHEGHVETARGLVAAAMAEGLDDEAVAERVRDALLAAYPDYGIPGGQPTMVELSARGVLAELRALHAGPGTGR